MTEKLRYSLSILLILGVFALSLGAKPPQAFAANDLKVENRNGVMYVTTDVAPNSTTTVTSTSQTTTTTERPLVQADVLVPKGYFQNFSVLFNNLLRVALVIAALLVFAYLILGGFQWITSGGEKAKTEAARNKITSAIIGLVILAASYAILTLVLNFLGFRDLNDLFENSGRLNSENPQSASSSATLRRFDILR
jgi:hypothetical protein